MEDSVVYAVATVLVFASILSAYWANENSLLFRISERCLPLPRSFHATSRLKHVTGELGERPKTFWAFDVLEPTDAVRSATVPTWLLLAWRISYIAFFIVAFAAETASDSLPEPQWLSFFTNWTFIMMGVTGAVGTVVLAMHFKNDPRTWDFGMKLMVLLDQIVLTNALFLSLFYWAVLRTGKMDMDNFMRHGINVVWMLVYHFMSRVPFVSYHLIAALLYVGVYCFFMWIYEAVSGKWTYAALDVSQPLSLLYYFAIPIMDVVCFYILFGLTILRDLATRATRVQHSSSDDEQDQLKAGKPSTSVGIAVGGARNSADLEMAKAKSGDLEAGFAGTG